MLERLSQITHNDDKHKGSAKRGVVNGVAGLDGSGDILDASGNTAVVQDVGGDVDIIGELQGSLLNNYMVQKAGFDVLGLMTDPRFLNLMCEDPGAGTMVDVSGQGHDGTYQGSMTTNDRYKRAMGWALDFDGINDYISIPDHNDFSFGDGSNDSPLSIFGVVEVINSGTQIFISKRDDSAGTVVREYYVGLSTDESLIIVLYDNSADVSCSRITDVPLSIGTHSIGITYDGTGGATAANGITIYVDGIEVASTPTNNGSYVAMENLTMNVLIGAYTGAAGIPSSFMEGDMSCMGVDGSEWSAMDTYRFHQLMKGLYGL